MSKATVVLPAPPTVTFPQQTTGIGDRHPGRATRRAVAIAVSAASGLNRTGSASPPPRDQKVGARRISLPAEMTSVGHKRQKHSGGPIRQVGVPLRDGDA